MISLCFPALDYHLATTTAYSVGSLYKLIPLLCCPSLGHSLYWLKANESLCTPTHQTMGQNKQLKSWPRPLEEQGLGHLLKLGMKPLFPFIIRQFVRMRWREREGAWKGWGRGKPTSLLDSHLQTEVHTIWILISAKWMFFWFLHSYL